MTGSLRRGRRSSAGLADLQAAALVDGGPEMRALAHRYSVKVPGFLLDRLTTAKAAPGLRRQFVPELDELAPSPGETADPIGDGAHEVVPGVIHRYADRALLKVTTSCPAYCRFCFRREEVGRVGSPLTQPAGWSAALNYLRKTPAIWEVILSGGDPLGLTADRLGVIMRDLAAIDHIASVRIHTRVPLLAPNRIDGALIDALAIGKPVWVALHTNHPDEFSAEGDRAIEDLLTAGIPLLGQSVLLAGVNDDATTLSALFRTMVTRRIKPYYLHHPDRAPGTGHFYVPISRGRALYAALRGQLSGLAMPQYVIDLPGGHAKVPLDDAWARETSDGWVIRDPSGRQHRLPN